MKSRISVIMMTARMRSPWARRLDGDPDMEPEPIEASGDEDE